MSGRLPPRAVWALLGVLGLLVCLNVPVLGSDPWPFQPDRVEPRGILGPLVRAADRQWDLGTIRHPAVLAGLAVALAGLVAVRLRPERTRLLLALAVLVVLLLTVPAVLLQVGLRDATAPWYFDNDSTYQIDLGGELLLHGDNPYGHDYRDSGLERFYDAAGVRSEREQVALSHFAYFPGTPLTAAVWRLVPAPFDDYRVLVLLATLALFGAVLLFPAPVEWRLAVAAAVAANPLAVRGAWFGTADAPSLLCLVLAFALVARRRFVAAAAALAAAVLLKQFALVAVPFVAVMMLRRGRRDELRRAGLVFAGILAAGIVPFLVADAGGLWRDTVSYGASTYRIIGYGLASIFLNTGLIDDRYSAYPFLPIVLLTWVPATAWLLWSQWRARALWPGAAGFAVSMFVLLFVSRVFQTSYLIWPLTGIAVAALLAVSERPGATAD